MDSVAGEEVAAIRISVRVSVRVIASVRVSVRLRQHTS